MTNDNLKKFLRKLIRKLIRISIVVVIVVLLPDLLFQVRCLIKNLPGIKNVLYNGLTDKEYVQIMMSTLVNCVAVSVSIFAYYVARATGSSQINQYQQEILMSATNLKRNIRKNSYIIFDVKKGTGDIQKLQWNKELEKYIFCLVAAKKITNEQRETLQTYIDKISKIQKYHDEGDEKNKEEKISEYSRKFLNDDADSMEFNSQMNEIIATLTHIVEGE